MANPEQRGLTLREGFEPFRGQGWKRQVLVFAGGLVVWATAYALVLSVTGWESVATGDSPAAVHGRRNAAAVATGATGAYFGVLWTRARGGPVLNVLYLVGVVAVVPDAVYALGGTPPEHTVSTAGPVLGLYATNPVWLGDHLIAWMPGVVVFFATLTYWIRSLSPDEERAFAENHLPESWLRLRGTVDQ